MPTVRIQYNPEKGYEEILDRLADDMPAITAPQMNVGGRALHDGGVSETEIMVEFHEFSPRDRNVNDIQVTVIAHAFPQRLARLDEATEAIKQGVMAIFAEFDRNVKVGISIWLVQMGYTTI